MSLVQKLVRPAIARLMPYRSARSLATTANVFLDANEAAEAPDAINAIEFVRELNRYPLPQPPALVERFSELYGVDASQVFIGRGSDEAIDVLTRTFCDADQDAILITPPTYGMYEVAANIQGARVVAVGLLPTAEGWTIDVPTILARLKSAGPQIKLIYICSPNNPTGDSFSLADIRTLCQASVDTALIVLDEAYREFAPQDSGIPLMREFKNLVVLRTLSKAWALAGLRCGVALGDPELIALLQKVRAPYPLPRPVIELALYALSPEGKAEMLARVKTVTSERTRVANALNEFPGVEKVFPSAGNFLLVRFTDHQLAMTASRSAGVVIRSRDTETGLKNCIRLTIGTATENDLLLQALKNGAGK